MGDHQGDNWRLDDAGLFDCGCGGSTMRLSRAPTVRPPFAAGSSARTRHGSPHPPAVPVGCLGQHRGPRRDPAKVRRCNCHAERSRETGNARQPGSKSQAQADHVLLGRGPCGRCRSGQRDRPGAEGQRQRGDTARSPGESQPAKKSENLRWAGDARPGRLPKWDHIIPLAQAHELGNELANLEMLSATLNRAKSDKVGERQLALAKKFHDAGLLSDATMANIQAKFVPSGTGKYELPVG
jgi:hypothetical protein